MARRYNFGGSPLPAGLLLATLATAPGLSCSGSPPRDINFGTDAGAGFEIPVRETGADVSGVDATDDTASTGGTGGAAGAGVGGAAGTEIDASTD